MQEWGAGEEYGDTTWVHLDPQKVLLEKLKALQKLKESEVYSYVDRGMATSDSGGTFVKTRWVLTEKGDGGRCRFVARSFAQGDPRDDLFAGTPPLFVARLPEQGGEFGLWGRVCNGP